MALLQQHLDKLPLTAVALDEVVETREEFAVRRVRYIGETFPQEYIYATRWRLIRQAGVARLVADPRVKAAIDAAFERYNLPSGRS
jgi:hypothetical protein